MFAVRRATQLPGAGELQRYEATKQNCYGNRASIHRHLKFSDCDIEEAIAGISNSGVRTGRAMNLMKKRQGKQ